MGKLKPTYLIIIIIGTLSSGFGLYGMITGQAFGEHFLSLVIGISLIGVALINNKNEK